MPTPELGNPDADTEVPHMTSDIYYGFDSRDFRASLEKPAAPIRGRQFRSTYAMADGGLAIANGPGFFNRPLYTPGCRTLLNAGDRPALLLWTIADYPKPGNPGWGLPGYLGRLFVGLSHGGASKWLHDFADCRTLYHPGWVEYRLQDPAFPGLTAQVEFLPHASGAVWVEVSATLPPGAAEDPVLVWTHGCIGFASTDRNQHYDAGCGMCGGRLDWDEPHLAENDTVAFRDGLAILRDPDDPANWVAMGSAPCPAALFVANADQRLQLAPDDLGSMPPAGRPVAAGRIPLPAGPDGSRRCRLALNWGRNSDPSAVMPPLLADHARQVADAKRYFQERVERIAIRTPDPELDTAFRFAVIGADSMWHPPGINHSAYAWAGLTTIFRTFYGLTCCGDHDRVASALRLHGEVEADGRLRNLCGGVGQPTVASCYQSYGSTVDMLWHHHLWSDDPRLLAEWKPVVDALIAYQERNRKDARGLYIDRLGFWASDAFNYEEGCASETAFVWRMYCVRGWIAEALGEDPAPFQRRAEEIKALFFRLLWNEEGGYCYDVVSPTGEPQPTTIAPAIYHTIEYGLATGREAERMLDWLEAHLLSPAGLVRVDDWFPIRWSHNVYSPLETANAAVAAFRLRRAATGHRMLHAIARGTVERTLVPGAIMCMSSADGALRNGTDFGDGVSLFLRASIEGLFGVLLDKPHRLLRLEPNLPAEWNHAAITLPDLGELTYRQEPVVAGVRHVYALSLASPLRLSASLPASGAVGELQVNGTPCQAPEGTDGGSFVALELPEGTHFEIAFTVAATAAADTPPASLASESPRAGATQAVTPERAAVFEPVPLDGLPPVPFANAFKLFPGEQLFQFNYPAPDDKPLRFMLDARFDDKPAEVRVTRADIPFRFNPAQVVAFKSKHDDKGHFKPVPLYALDFEVPETLVVPVGKPAAAVWLLASGLHSVMTCHLPQVEIALEYADGRVLRRRLTAPDEFDFILQHSTTHPSVAIGWFGTDEELQTLEQERAAANDPLFRLTRRLHADVIRLDGCDGLLERIVLTPLQRHSGMLLYGLTLEQPSQGDAANAKNRE